MSDLSNEHILQQLRWRYATKQFDPARKVSDADLKTLIDAMVLAPSSFGLQPWKFLVITDAALRQRLLGASWGQSQVIDASHLIVFAARRQIDAGFVDHFISTTATHRKTEPAALKGYRDVIVDFVEDASLDKIHWATRQVYIALGFLMETAALLKIDACPMEGIEPAQYDEILGLGPMFATACACPIGYRSADDKYANFAKVRFDASEVVEYR